MMACMSDGDRGATMKLLPVNEVSMVTELLRPPEEQVEAFNNSTADEQVDLIDAMTQTNLRQMAGLWAKRPEMLTNSTMSVSSQLSILKKLPANVSANVLRALPPASHVALIAQEISLGYDKDVETKNLAATPKLDAQCVCTSGPALIFSSAI